MNAVPAARLLLLARRHRGAAPGARPRRLRQIKMHVAARDFGERRRRMHLELEAEMLCVEIDRRLHVVDEVAETRGHAPLLWLVRYETYPFRNDTSTFRFWPHA